ncbi:MAG TPA: glutamine cyclotransferase [Polyangiaceae bacterium]|nr:glutamine cyclotransferase [Polyangiaceae bacterium]
MSKEREVRPRPAEVVREYGPFGTDHIAGLTFDGERVWYAAKDRMQSLDVEEGSLGAAFAVPATAGTAFDGRHFYQIGNDVIRKVDAKTGAVVKSMPTPGPPGTCAGLTWAEGKLWVGVHKSRKILQLDPETGRVLKEIPTARFVTGVTFVDGDLWHGTLENEVSDLRRVDPDTGEELDRLEMPEGTYVTGLETDGKDLLYCGGGASSKVRAVKRPKR